jgi:hypothetical protein
MAPSEHSDCGIVTHCCKRAASAADSGGGTTKRARHDEAVTTMPQSLFPLVWSFLLEPPSSDNHIDPESMTGCIDFQSIASFMLVNRGEQRRPLMSAMDGGTVEKP